MASRIYDKVNVKYCGYNYTLKPDINHNASGAVVSLNIHKTATISMIRQYINFKYPKKDWKLWIRSQGSLGIDIFVSRKTGGEIAGIVFMDIKTFADLLIYDTNSDYGTPLKMECKTIRVFNRPPFGKLEDVERVDTDDDSLEFKEKY